MAPATSPTQRSSGAPPVARDAAAQACVGDAAVRAGRRRRVVRAGAWGLAPVQVRYDRVVAVVGEVAGNLLGLVVIPGHVVDDDYAAARSLVEGAGAVGLDLVAVVAGDHDGLGEKRVRHLCLP